MFCSRNLNNSSNHIRERALILVHDNYNNSFYYILEMSNKRIILLAKTEHIAKEIYKFTNGLSPPIMNDFSTLEKFLTTSEMFSACFRH